MCTTLLFALFTIYNVNSQCNSPTFNGIELRTSADNGIWMTDETVYVTVYNDFSIYLCAFEPSQQNKYYSCTTESGSCCNPQPVATYCDPINHGRLIIHNPGDDAVTIDEITVLTTNNNNNCNDINYAMMNWCIDTITFNTLPSQQRSEISGLTSHCADTQTHVTALYVRTNPNAIPTVETNFLRNDFTNRQWINATGFNTFSIQSEPCPTIDTTTSTEILTSISTDNTVDLLTTTKQTTLATHSNTATTEYSTIVTTKYTTMQESEVDDVQQSGGDDFSISGTFGDQSVSINIYLVILLMLISCLCGSCCIYTLLLIRRRHVSLSKNILPVIEEHTPSVNVKLHHFGKNGMKNVQSNTNDVSVSEMIGDTPIFTPNELGTIIYTEQLDTPTNMYTNTNMYANGTFKRAITPKVLIEGEEMHEKSVIENDTESHDVNMINESKPHKSQHGMLNDSLTVTEGNDHESTTETVNISIINDREDTLESIFVDVMNKTIENSHITNSHITSTEHNSSPNTHIHQISEQNSHFYLYDGDEKSIIVPIAPIAQYNDEEKENSHLYLYDGDEQSIIFPNLPIAPIAEHISEQIIDNIKLILYDFDQTITTIHLYRELNGKDVNQLEISNERLIQIFGGNDRIQRLHKHFKYLVSKNIKLAVLSFGFSNVIQQALNRTNMLQYFSFITGRDSESMKQASHKKTEYILNLIEINNYNKRDVLFVDDEPSNIESVIKLDCCQTMLIQPRIGMNEKHLQYIEDELC